MGRCAAGWGSGWGYLRVGDEARAKGRGGTRDRTERAHAQSRTIAHHRQTPRHGGCRSPKTTSATRPPVHFLRCLWRARRHGSRRARQSMWHVTGTWLARGWYQARPDRHSRGGRRQRPRAAGKFQRRRLGACRARRGWRASPCSSRAAPRGRVRVRLALSESQLTKLSTKLRLLREIVASSGVRRRISDHLYTISDQVSYTGDQVSYTGDQVSYTGDHTDLITDQVIRGRGEKREREDAGKGGGSPRRAPGNLRGATPTA